jgi:hypothetical protein
MEARRVNIDRIEVYCQEASHAEKRWRIGTFERLEGDDHWHMDAHLARGGQKQTVSGSRRLPLVLTANPAEADRIMAAARERYPLRCRRCTLELPISDGSATMRRLQSMLDKLALAGVSEVPLSALIARFT